MTNTEMYENTFVVEVDFGFKDEDYKAIIHVEFCGVIPTGYHLTDDDNGSLAVNNSLNSANPFGSASSRGTFEEQHSKVLSTYAETPDDEDVLSHDERYVTGSIKIHIETLYSHYSDDPIIVEESLLKEIHAFLGKQLGCHKECSAEDFAGPATIYITN